MYEFPFSSALPREITTYLTLVRPFDNYIWMMGIVSSTIVYLVLGIIQKLWSYQSGKPCKMDYFYQGMHLLMWMRCHKTIKMCFHFPQISTYSLDRFMYSHIFIWTKCSQKVDQQRVYYIKKSPHTNMANVCIKFTSVGLQEHTFLNPCTNFLWRNYRNLGRRGQLRSTTFCSK